MTIADSAAHEASPSNVVLLNSRRSELAELGAICRQTAAVLRSLATRTATEPDLEVADREDGTRDDAATKKAAAKARRVLRNRLPAVTDQLQRLSTAVRDGHASLSEADCLHSLATVFESLINPRGVLSGGTCCDISESINLVRGSAYVLKNGDVACNEGASAIFDGERPADRNDRSRARWARSGPHSGPLQTTRTFHR